MSEDLTSGKLTAEFIRSSRVTFAPATVHEAEVIQRWMFRHGIYWIAGQKEIWDPQLCVERTMLVKDGSMRVGAADSTYIRASPKQLAGLCQEDLISHEEKLLARIAALESEVAGLHGKLDQVLDALKPKVLGKAALAPRTPGGPS